MGLEMQAGTANEATRRAYPVGRADGVAGVKPRNQMHQHGGQTIARFPVEVEMGVQSAGEDSEQHAPNTLAEPDALSKTDGRRRDAIKRASEMGWGWARRTLL